MDYSYIQHHGILGQRWGVRRYQNKDGSLTAAGRRRAGLRSKKSDDSAKEKSSTPAKKTVKDMTDAELQEKIRRLELEKRYSDLQAATNPQVNRGKKFVKDYISPATKKVIWDTSVDVAAQAVKRILSKQVNDAITKKEKEKKREKERES